MADADFSRYVVRSRRALDRAVRAALRGLVGRTPVGDKASLITALAGGKKVRGCLTCIVGEALGSDPKNLVPRAVAIELIQAATLIHDDFVDEDTTRRSRPAVWTMTGGRRAVLVGDVIFAGAIRMMSELSREDGLSVSRAIASISTGALNEPLAPADLAPLIENEGGNSARWYRKIIRLKTGILFGAACELGAIGAGASPGVREAAYRYGLKTGDAYQIADDLRDARACISDGCMRPGQLAGLAPAFLCFAGESRGMVLEGLRKGGVNPGNGLARLVSGIEKPMEREIERLLRSAASEIERHFPQNPAWNLACRAPWGTISLFNEAL
jgi:hypothetical protein